MNHQNITTTMPAIWAIVPAAGVGRRMAKSRPKQYLELNGKTILEHSLEQLCRCETVAGVAVGIADNDNYWEKLGIKNNKLLGVYSGGTERIHTVLNGLDFLSKWIAQDDWVMVHDAVRPCVRVEDINRLIEKAIQAKRSAILVNPVIDTVKKVNSQADIETTLNRDELMLAMTPQLFPYALLKRALEAAIKKNILVTDESSTVEMLGEKPLAVQGMRSNIKITTVEDLELANYFLNKTRMHEQEK